MNIEAKIQRAVSNGKLNPMILGCRKWYSYIIQIEELVWVRNFHDGYKIHVYENDNGEIGRHLETVWI